MADKVRVKMRTIMAGDYGTAAPGSIVEVPVHVAEELLRTRQAEPAPPLPKPAKPVAEDDEEETATAPPSSEETATLKRLPSRRR
ncbi:MAG: hypothetical protein KGO96_12865 [Elusimicrobia bacterium]|nr:hypothetical protein [Elusimicrobiota bacterium]